MVERTCRFIFEHDRFKVLSAGRTDAKVSAEHAAFELFMEEEVESGWLEKAFNENLPNDIRVLRIEEVGPEFNIIQSPRIKEYIYLFSHGEKNHPFCAPLMVYMEENLDVMAMKSAAALFNGKHDFTAFCHKPTESNITVRDIVYSEVCENTEYTASFFPERSWMYTVRSSGFLRHQVRLMMGALFAVGSGQIGEKEIKAALNGEIKEPLAFMAPQSGLILRKIEFS